MFQALLGPALSFGSSLLSGFGAQKSAKKQQKLQAAYEYQNSLVQQWHNEANLARGQQIVKYYDPATRAVADAETAGFNPVTWLQNMGGMYSAMTQYGHQLQQAVPYFQNAPTAQVPSTLEVVGNGLQAGVQTYLSDRRVAQSQDFQREMLQTQLNAIQRNAKNGVSQSFFGSGQIPYSVSQGGQMAGNVGGTTQLPGGLSKAFTPIGVWDPKAESAGFTNPYGYGSSIATGVADAGAMENRIGDADSPMEPGWYYKWWVTANDLSKNSLGVNVPQGFRRGMAEVFGYPVYPDGARGLSWGRGAPGYNPGQLPGFGYSTGGQF